MKVARPFEISKQLVWESYLEVKRKGGSAGVDNQTLDDFAKDLKRNLYKIWNRMSSGSYFPPSVKAVPIPKKLGGSRILGVPCISDRIAQTVAKKVLEPILEPIFDEDSFGYRPNRSAHDAIAKTRKRCWEYDWVVEFDIKGLFDNIDHEMVMKALRHHCKNRWVLLYVERWLKASLVKRNGDVIQRDKGTPQGGVVSPILANLFLHYAFDAWVRREMPSVPFCRYADDGLLHCRSKKQAQHVMRMITKRFESCKLEIHPDKSKIIHCKDKNRKEDYSVISFDFLGFTFRPRRCVGRKGNIHPNFLPAVSRASLKSINREIRSWHIQLKNDKSLEDLSKMFNPVLQGWFNYYGKFYPSAMRRIWRNFNEYLMQWIRRKYKRFAKHKRQAWKHIDNLALANPNFFIHWQLEVFPRSSSRSRMS